MLAISDGDLMEQCQRVLPSRTAAAPRPIKTLAAHASQHSTNSPRSAAMSLAAPEDDAATLPIGDDELSPHTRSFISIKQKEKPASRQLLEAWRAGQADVSPSKATTGGQRSSGPSEITRAVSPPPAPLDELTARRAPRPCDAAPVAAAPAAADTDSAHEQLAGTVSLDGANARRKATQTAPKQSILLQRLLKGL